MDKAQQSTEVKPVKKRYSATQKQSPDTSHLTVVDEQRNAVSLTFGLITALVLGLLHLELVFC